MSQMNPKEVFHSTAYSVQLPYIAGHSLLKETEFVYSWETNLRSFAEHIILIIMH